jgi:hypothetical protein
MLPPGPFVPTAVSHRSHTSHLRVTPPGALYPMQPESNREEDLCPSRQQSITPKQPITTNTPRVIIAKPQGITKPTITSRPRTTPTPLRGIFITRHTTPRKLPSLTLSITGKNPAPPAAANCRAATSLHRYDAFVDNDARPVGWWVRLEANRIKAT